MKSQTGISLIEFLLVVAMIGIVIILMANLPNTFILMNKSKHLSLAREIAAKQIEDKRTVSFSNLVNDTTAVNDARINLLPQGAGIVVVADCDVSICTSGENVKKVTVNISWKDNNKAQNITLTTFLGEGGLNQ